jgi:hypothetical protein
VPSEERLAKHGSLQTKQISFEYREASDRKVLLNILFFKGVNATGHILNPYLMPSCVPKIVGVNIK